MSPIPENVTHVAAWLPEGLLKNRASGWELRTLDDYALGARTGKIGGTVPFLPGHFVASDTDEALLAEWVADRVGHPVKLTWDEVQVKANWHSRFRPASIYYVSAAQS